MAKKLFVGNISWSSTEDSLRDAFAEFGVVEEVIIIKDRATGRSKGFGFVTFTNNEEADKAIAAMDGKEVDGRELAVNEARPPKQDF